MFISLFYFFVFIFVSFITINEKTKGSIARYFNISDLLFKRILVASLLLSVLLLVIINAVTDTIKYRKSVNHLINNAKEFSQLKNTSDLKELINICGNSYQSGRKVVSEELFQEIMNENDYKNICTNGRSNRKREELLIDKYEKVRSADELEKDFEFKFFKSFHINSPISFSEYCLDYSINRHSRYYRKPPRDYFFLDENNKKKYTNYISEFSIISDNLKNEINSSFLRGIDTSYLLRIRDEAIAFYNDYVDEINYTLNSNGDSSNPDKFSAWVNGNPWKYKGVLYSCERERQRQKLHDTYLEEYRIKKERENEPLAKKLGRTAKSLKEGAKKVTEPIKEKSEELLDQFKEGYDD